jgi:two-component system, OmpR family, response regulator CpxR
LYPPLRTRSHSIGHFVTTQYSVLVVEDDRLLCDVFSDLLSEAGYDVRCAHDGEDAWTQIQRNPPDVILSDIRMPRLDGVALASRLASHGYMTPIIFMSANPVDRGGACAAFIRKPFACAHLLAVIANALNPLLVHPVNATA